MISMLMEELVKVRIEMPELFLVCSAYLYSQSITFFSIFLTFSILGALFRYGNDVSEKREKKEALEKQQEKLESQIEGLVDKITLYYPSKNTTIAKTSDDSDFH